MNRIQSLKFLALIMGLSLSSCSETINEKTLTPEDHAFIESLGILSL
jgi:hypothetical protein